MEGAAKSQEAGKEIASLAGYSALARLLHWLECCTEIDRLHFGDAKV